MTSTSEAVGITGHDPFVECSSRLRQRLRSRRFLLTAELECPRSASAANVRRQACAYGPYVDAIDCTDNSAAVVRMSPVAAAAIAVQEAPIVLVQLTCRDRNRLALESEILGAAAVGAAGIVCMGGDPPETGNHPRSKGVYDLSTVELIATVGRRCHDLVIGCVENPADGERSLERLAAKAAAGAEFAQTQITFDAEALSRWMERVRAERLHEQLCVLVGVAPVRKLSVARYLQERVAGVSLPAGQMRRLKRAPDPEAEGVELAAEIAREAREIEGVAGVHLMTFGWIDGVRRVVERV